jgi:hypothetical protein
MRRCGVAMMVIASGVLVGSGRAGEDAASIANTTETPA